ncbi:MAG: polysaccharide pyruvyl transferase family protein [Oscillospiraceae bacterium]|nr:polysaccharide pyruvyl transferase family protein [Oscillospiraceae bacterium]
MGDNVFLILPGCDDTNRGDQALIWQTVRLAKAAGYEGSYYMLSEPEHCRQSAAEGIGQLDYILHHPSARYTKHDNIHYGLGLKLKWALAAGLDLLTREPLAHKWSRRLLLPLYSKKTRKTLDYFRRAEAAFVKGGGFLHAYGGFADTYKIYFFLYHLRLAQSFGVKVYVMPNSFGPFKSPLVKGMIRNVLKKCPVVMARESISQQMLREHCGIEAAVYADLAFHLESDPDFDPYACLARKGIDCRNEKCVAITARPYRFSGEADGPGKYEAYKNALTEFAVWLDGNGYHPVLVEHVFSDMDHENDMTCLAEIAQRLEGRCRFSLFADRSLTSRQMKQIYGTFTHTVGTRFHSVIFSLASGVPSIAITYGGNKGDGIMADSGLQAYALPIHTVTAKKLIGAFQSMSGDAHRLRREISAAQEKLRQQQAQIIDTIRK